MKNFIPILLAVVVLSSGCDCDGYSCTSEGCYAENNAQYLTLEDCLSVCDEIYFNSAVFETCGDQIGHEEYNYSTVQIGDQCWFAENCRYLPVVSPFLSSEGNDTEPYYYVNGYESSYVAAAQATENYETYGVLYNWPAVMTEGICPSGWHIPSDAEFTQLTDFLGGVSVAGDAMKSTSGWSNENGSNSSGFTGLPGGVHSYSVLDFDWWNGYWWTASEDLGSLSWMRYLNNFNDDVGRGSFNRFSGFSARCVRD